MPEFIESNRNNVSETYEEAPIQYPSADAWKYQIDTTDVLEEISHHLRGEFRVVKRVALSSGVMDEQISWEKKGKRLLNEDGIRLVITMVGGRLSKVHTLTDIPEERVDDMCRWIMIDMASHLSLHHKNYECVEFPLDTTTLTLLIGLIMDYIYPSLSRGSEGRFLKYLKPTIERKEIVRGMPEEKKKSLIPFM